MRSPDEEFGAELIGQDASLRAYARRLTGDGADADDLVQDTMLRCWTARAVFAPGSNLNAWTRTIMRNSFLNGRRRARFQADLPEDAFDRLLGVTEAQERAVELHEVDRALRALIPKYRDAVVLASEGLTVEEAALRLQVPEGTFKSRVARGRRRLRDLTENRDAHRPAQQRTETARAARRPPRDWKGMVIG